MVGASRRRDGAGSGAGRWCLEECAVCLYRWKNLLPPVHPVASEGKCSAGREGQERVRGYGRRVVSDHRNRDCHSRGVLPKGRVCHGQGCVHARLRRPPPTGLHAPGRSALPVRGASFLCGVARGSRWWRAGRRLEEGSGAGVAVPGMCGVCVGRKAWHRR